MSALISISEFQEMCRISRSTVYRLIERGEIERVNIGRAVRLRREDVDRWMTALSAIQASDGHAQ